MSTEDKLRGYLKRVTAELLETRERLAGEPVAIVGMACRFPGRVRTPEDLWELLLRGGSVVSGTPEDRNWNLAELTVRGPDGTETPGTFGAFLHDAADFDADFFGISPREAVAMDPQHRLLLETSWEALERAGIPADSLRGSRTGVYTGIISGDHAAHLAASGAAGLDGYFINGAGAAFASGRIAYTLGLHGPAVTIDTACSSSLVALHDACQALRYGDCTTALVGGAAVVSTPAMLVEFGRQGGLAPDGRCKPFAASADGTAFSEGVGVLVLERLSDALRAGHEVLAVVRGTAVNQDGASNGLTAPNGLAQEQVIRQALANARLTPDQVDAVEAHGTGTTLGDPIEGRALLATYGSQRPDGRPLLVGSVKSNIGHTQAAAGVAGVIKTVLALRHGVLPASVGIDEPTPHVDWSSGGVRLLRETTPWPETGAPRRAAVSSFSLSGTNAHAVIEQAPAPQEPAPRTPADDAAAEAPAPLTAAPLPAVPWTLSARTPDALRDQAARLLDHLAAHPDTDGSAQAQDDADIALTLATGRSALRHRAVVVGTDRAELTAGLAALAAGEDAPQLVRGTAPAGEPAGAVFVFPGQGPQWAGMGARLMETSPVFAARVEECLDLFAPHLDWSLADVLRGAPGARSLDEDEVVQPALFTMMVSLAALWESCGVRPTAVVGHSQGEIAAACVAGALSLPDAVRLVALRNRPIRAAITGRGGMASLPRPAAEVEKLLERWGGRLSVAAVNGPSATAVSGDIDALEELFALCAADGTPVHRIPIDYASHSAHLDAVEQDLLDTIGTLTPRETTVPFYSTVTARPIDGRELTAAYWFENLRRPVDFAGAVEALLADGHRAFIECGAHPVLVHGLEETIERQGADAPVVTTLRRGHGGPERFLASLGRFHAHGGRVDWRALLARGGARPVPLPTYAFQRRRFWLDVPAAPAGDARSLGQRPVGHPLAGAAVDIAGDDAAALYTARLSVRDLPWLADHTVAGTPLLPGTATVELAAHLAGRTGLAGVDELTLHAPVAAPDEDGLALQTAVGAPDATGRRPFALYTRPEDAPDDTPWTRHAEGTLAPAAGTPVPDPEEWAPLRGAWPPADARPVDLTGLYERLAGHGLAYGPAFRGLRAVWRRGDELFAEVALGDAAPADTSAYGLHPALLDAALHAVFADGPEEPELRLPFGWQGVTVHRGGATELRVRITRPGDGRLALLAADPAGEPVLSVSSLLVRPVRADQLRAAGASHRDSLFRLDWAAVPAADAPAGRWAVLGTAPSWLPAPAHAHADLAALTAAVRAGAPAPDVVLAPVDPVTAGGDTGSAAAADAVGETLRRVLALVQAWTEDDHLAGSRLVLATRHAAAVDGDHRQPHDLAGAAVWGLVRSAQAEHPGRLVLLDTDGTPESARALPAALATGEPQTALRAGAVRAARLVRVPAAAARTAPEPYDPSGTVLVTGGLGVIGSLVARHLVTARGARHLILAGRRGQDTPGAAELAAELAESGATVTVARCDVADRADLAALIGSVPADRPLVSVVHIAGVADDGVLGALTPERLDAVLRPKADAALHLHDLTRDLDLREFVLFSSLSGVLGRAGQANYAAANAFLDALARHRHRAGLPATSLAWGLWAQASAISGGIVDDGARRTAAEGVAAMAADEALALLDAALGTARALDAPALVAARLDLPALRARAARTGDLPPVLGSLVRVTAPAAPVSGRGPSAASGPDALRGELAGLAAPERLERVTALVRAKVAAVLGHDGAGDTVAPDRAFKELGFDSLTAVELRNQLGTATGVRLPATLVFDYPTPEALAAFLAEQLATGPADTAAPAGAGTSEGGGAAAVDAAVEHLDSVLSSAALDDTARGQVVARLKELVRTWSPAPQDLPVPLETATPDDLFSLLDEQLGNA